MTTNRRVLIVDDNEMASELLGEFLEMSGHTVHLAHSGSHALACVQAEPVEVCIVDIVLPDTDGYALATAMRAHRDGLRIIALSGLPKNMRAGDSTVFDAWLEKPANLDTLEAMLGQVGAPAANTRSTL